MAALALGDSMAAEEFPSACRIATHDRRPVLSQWTGLGRSILEPLGRCGRRRQSPSCDRLDNVKLQFGWRFVGRQLFRPTEQLIVRRGRPQPSQSGERLLALQRDRGLRQRFGEQPSAAGRVAFRKLFTNSGTHGRFRVANEPLEQRGQLRVPTLIEPLNRGDPGRGSHRGIRGPGDKNPVVDRQFKPCGELRDFGTQLIVRLGQQRGDRRFHRVANRRRGGFPRRIPIASHPIPRRRIERHPQGIERVATRH